MDANGPRPRTPFYHCLAMEVVPPAEALDALEHLAELLPSGTGLERRKELNLLRRRLLELAERVENAKEQEQVEVQIQLLSGSVLGTLQLRLQETVAWQ